MRIDLTDLRLFVNVAETSSITRGAERSHLSLASASARIRSMEDALGVRLLDRGRRGVRLLPAGEKLLAHARSVLAQMAKLRADLGAHAGGAKGRVRVLSNTAAMADLLPDVLAGYLAANPGIDIELEEHPSDAIARDLAAGRADVGVLSDKADLSGLQVFPLRADPLVLVVPSADRCARKETISYAEVADRDFIGLGAGVAFQQYVERCALQRGRPMKVRLRVGSFDDICRVVRHGTGLGVVTLAAATRCASAIGVRAMPLEEPWATRTLSVGVRDAATLSIPARTLVEHLSRPLTDRP